PRGAGGGLDEVADVDVVARLLAVAVDLEGPRAEHRLGEDRDDAGLPGSVLPRPVDVAIPEDLGPQAVDDLVIVHVLLDRKLRAAVRRDGVGRMGLRGGAGALGLAVDRAA